MFFAILCPKSRLPDGELPTFDTLDEAIAACHESDASVVDGFAHVVHNTQMVVEVKDGQAAVVYRHCPYDDDDED